MNIHKHDVNHCVAASLSPPPFGVFSQIVHSKLPGSSSLLPLARSALVRASRQPTARAEITKEAASAVQLSQNAGTTDANMDQSTDAELGANLLPDADAVLK